MIQCKQVSIGSIFFRAAKINGRLQKELTKQKKRGSVAYSTDYTTHKEVSPREKEETKSARRGEEEEEEELYEKEIEKRENAGWKEE